MDGRVFVFDSGNRLVKAVVNEDGKPKRDAWVHAVQEISNTEYENEIARGTHDDLFVINDKYYRVGYRAEASSNALRGANRYRNQEYYQALLGVSMFALYPKSRRDITLFAGHAPQDIRYRDDIRASAMYRPIVVENNGDQKTFRVKRVEFWDEPIGGMMHCILTDTGKQAKGTSYASGSTIVFDIGGYTVDCAVVENNQVRTDELDSFNETNLITMERDLFYALRDQYPDIMSSAEKGRLGNALRNALMTGKFDAGGYGLIDISQMVNDTLYKMVNFIVNVYEQRGGTLRFHNVVLTGGGAVVIEQYIRHALTQRGRENGKAIYLAGTRNDAIYTNALGASRLASFYARHGKI